MSHLSPCRKTQFHSKTCRLCPCCFLVDSPWPRLSLTLSQVRTMPGAVLTPKPLPASALATFLQAWSMESILFLAPFHILAHLGANSFTPDSAPLKSVANYDFSRDVLSTSEFPSCKTAVTILVFARAGGNNRNSLKHKMVLFSRGKKKTNVNFLLPLPKCCI